MAADASPTNLNVLCGAGTVAVFPEVKKPSEEMELFAVGAEATPAMKPVRTRRLRLGDKSTCV